MIENGDGTYTGGPLDVLIILKCGDRYHPAFLEERMPPGPVVDVRDVDVVRLQSRMHHTTGFATLEEAQADLRNDLAKKLFVPVQNIQYDPIDWDGEIPLIVVVENWRKIDRSNNEPSKALVRA